MPNCFRLVKIEEKVHGPSCLITQHIEFQVTDRNVKRQTWPAMFCNVFFLPFHWRYGFLITFTEKKKYKKIPPKLDEKTMISRFYMTFKLLRVTDNKIPKISNTCEKKKFFWSVKSIHTMCFRGDVRDALLKRMPFKSRSNQFQKENREKIAGQNPYYVTGLLTYKTPFLTPQTQYL